MKIIALLFTLAALPSLKKHNPRKAGDLDFLNGRYYYTTNNQISLAHPLASIPGKWVEFEYRDFKLRLGPLERLKLRNRLLAFSLNERKVLRSSTVSIYCAETPKNFCRPLKIKLKPKKKKITLKTKKLGHRHVFAIALSFWALPPYPSGIHFNYLFNVNKSLAFSVEIGTDYQYQGIFSVNSIWHSATFSVHTSDIQYDKKNRTGGNFYFGWRLGAYQEAPIIFFPNFQHFSARDLYLGGGPVAGFRWNIRPGFSLQPALELAFHFPHAHGRPSPIRPYSKYYGESYLLDFKVKVYLGYGAYFNSN